MLESGKVIYHNPILLVLFLIGLIPFVLKMYEVFGIRSVSSQ